MRGGKIALGLAYTAIGLIVAFATAMAFFPYKALETHLESVLRERTGAAVRLEETGYAFPLGLGADRAVVSRAQPDLAIEFTHIAIQWRPWGLLSGEQRFLGRASLCGGKMLAEARFGSLLPRDVDAASLEVRGISLSACAESLQLDPVSGVSGRLDGEARIPDPGRDWETASGNASLEVEEGGLALERGPLKGLALEDAGLTCRLGKSGRVLRVREARLDGSGIEADLSGKVRLAKQLRECALDLRAELVFHPARLAGRPDNPMVRRALARKGMDLVLKGTVGSPRVRMR